MYPAHSSIGVAQSSIGPTKASLRVTQRLLRAAQPLICPAQAALRPAQRALRGTQHPHTFTPGPESPFLLVCPRTRGIVGSRLARVVERGIGVPGDKPTPEHKKGRRLREGNGRLGRSVERCLRIFRLVTTRLTRRDRLHAISITPSPLLVKWLLRLYNTRTPK